MNIVNLPLFNHHGFLKTKCTDMLRLLFFTLALFLYILLAVEGGK